MPKADRKRQQNLGTQVVLVSSPRQPRRRLSSPSLPPSSWWRLLTPHVVWMVPLLPLLLLLCCVMHRLLLLLLSVRCLLLLHGYPLLRLLLHDDVPTLLHHQPLPRQLLLGRVACPTSRHPSVACPLHTAGPRRRHADGRSARLRRLLSIPSPAARHRRPAPPASSELVRGLLLRRLLLLLLRLQLRLLPLLHLLLHLLLLARRLEHRRAPDKILQRRVLRRPRRRPERRQAERLERHLFVEREKISEQRVARRQFPDELVDRRADARRVGHGVAGHLRPVRASEGRTHA